MIRHFARVALVAATMLPLAAQAQGGGQYQDFANELAYVSVRDVQQLLTERGFDTGPIDGVAGRRTTVAIQNYQRLAGLPVTGIADQALLNDLRFRDPPIIVASRTPPVVYQPPPAQPVVSQPSRPPAPAANAQVAEAQTYLAQLGYYTGSIDGLMGPRTRDAITRYQAAYGLPRDPRVTLALLGSLRANSTVATSAGPAVTWQRP